MRVGAWMMRWTLCLERGGLGAYRSMDECSVFKFSILQLAILQLLVLER